MKYLNFLLGELLFLANSRPPFWRSEFYKIKDHILKTHADLEGHHLQHIFKECFNCNGSGKVMKDVRMLGEWIRMSAGECPKCCGSGKYDEFWTVLESYCLGRRRFHRPIEKYYSRVTVPQMEFLELIEGHIRHEAPKYYLYDEAAFWLFLFFSPRFFFEHFGHSKQCARKFTPLVILGSLTFDIRNLIRKISDTVKAIQKKLIKIRQDFCRHEFPHTHVLPAWDECKHCRIKRMYIGQDRDVVPF